jgi:hypothetical protein
MRFAYRRLIEKLSPSSYGQGTMDTRHVRQVGPSRVLVIGGFLLLGMTFIALILNRDSATVGGLGVLGTGTLVTSVLVSRMEGKQEFGLTKWASMSLT